MKEVLRMVKIMFPLPSSCLMELFNLVNSERDYSRKRWAVGSIGVPLNVAR